MTLHLPRRPAYTLIELLVAVSLIIVLATLTVAVANSSLVDSYKIVGGADRLSGWLLQAKQRAVRDGIPVGLRLIRDTSNPTLCMQAQIVEMPTIYAPNPVSDLNSVPYGAPFVCIRYVNQNVKLPDNSINNALNQESNTDAGVFLFWPTPPFSIYPSLTIGVDLQAGDLIRLGELNSVHRISSINAIGQPTFYTNLGKAALPAGSWYKLTLAVSAVQLTTGQQFPSSPPYPTNLLPANFVFSTSVSNLTAGTAQNYPTGYPAIGGANYYQSYYFGLYRSSRPILGEPLLEMPTNMVVDVYPGLDVAPAGLANNLLAPSYNVPISPAGDIEVMFNPNGSVMFTNAGQIIFWLRDVRNGGGNEPLQLTSSPTAPNPVTPTIADFFINRPQLMNSGEHVLVSINAKTGAIGTYPVFPPDQTGRYDGRPISTSGGDGGLLGPYKYARNSSNTGL